MLANLKPRSLPLHRLTRFVTKEAIARLLKTHPDQIREIRRWAYVLLVVGKGISRFVSYADLPPIPNVAPPEGRDFRYWLRRWQKKLAPGFWAEFYAEKFQESLSLAELFEWGKLVGVIKFGLPQEMVQALRETYKIHKLALSTESNKPCLVAS